MAKLSNRSLVYHTSVAIADEVEVLLVYKAIWDVEGWIIPDVPEDLFYPRVLYKSYLTLISISSFDPDIPG